MSTPTKGDTMSDLRDAFRAAALDAQQQGAGFAQAARRARGLGHNAQAVALQRIAADLHRDVETALWGMTDHTTTETTTMTTCQDQYGHAAGFYIERADGAPVACTLPTDHDGPHEDHTDRETVDAVQSWERTTKDPTMTDQTDHAPTVYVIGHNVAGYSPEDDGPTYVVGTFDDAKRALIDEARYHADSVEVGAPGPFGEDYATGLVHMCEDLNLDNGPEWCEYVDHGEDCEHGIPVAWWITVVTDPDAIREAYNTEGVNPYAARVSETPDTGSYHPFAIMADGGTLCEHCVMDPTNPVQDGSAETNADDWSVVGWSHSGEVDGPESCDHCSRIIAEDPADA